MKTKIYGNWQNVGPQERVTIYVYFTGQAVFESLVDRAERAMDSIEARAPADVNAAARKSYRRLLKEFYLTQAECLVPAAQTAQKIIRQAQELTDGELFDVFFSHSLHCVLNVAKPLAKPLAALFSQVKGVESAVIDTGSGFNGDRFDGSVQTMRFYAENAPVTTIEELHMWDPNLNCRFIDVGLNGLVKSARRAAQRNAALLRASR